MASNGIENNNLLTRAFQWSVTVVMVGLILYVGKPLFIPLSFAIFISFLLQPVCVWFERRGWSRSASIAVSLILFLMITGALAAFVFLQFRNFIRDWPEIKSQLITISTALQNALVDRFGISEELVEKWMVDISNSLPLRSVSGIGATAWNIGVNLVMALLIPIYTYLILFYRQLLVDAIVLMIQPAKRKQVSEVIRLAIGTYYGFIKGMIVVYVIVGVLNSVGLLILGVPHAILFGFLTAIMTIIPYVGIVIASVMPIIYAWVTFQSVWYPIGVVLIFAFVQYLEANVIFPWAVSSRLKLNTFITLIIIIAGGILWGAAGMILFIPMAAILKLIADRMEGWEGLARVLGK